MGYYRRRSFNLDLNRQPSGSATFGIGVAPGPLEGQAPGMGSNQLMDRLWPPRAGGIKANRRRCFEQGYRPLPQPLNTLGGRKQGMVAAHRVEDQALIGLQHITDHACVM